MPVLVLSLYSDGFIDPAAPSAWKILSSATQPHELQTNSLETMSNITVSLSQCLQYVGLSLECICCSADSIATTRLALLLSLIFLEIREFRGSDDFHEKNYCIAVLDLEF
jgi:hypothetical protein